MITTTDINQFLRTCASRYHSEYVYVLLCIFSAADVVVEFGLGAYSNTWNDAFNIHQPIKWFWSKTCGKFARKTLKTADNLWMHKVLLSFRSSFPIIFLFSYLIRLGVTWNDLSTWLYPSSKYKCFRTIDCIFAIGFSSDGNAWSARDKNCISKNTSKWIVSLSDSSRSIIRCKQPDKLVSSPPTDWIWPSKRRVES